jgi:hypothetical protein
MRTAIALLLICSFALAQDPNTTIEQNSTLPWLSTTSRDFNHPASVDILDHLREHELIEEAKQLHEWHHQTIEALRPNGISSFIVIEATETDFANWPDADEIRSKGWKVIRKPMRSKPVSFVVLNKTHYSQRGLLTVASLNRFWTQHNRKSPPVKSSRARWVTKITMYTRGNCSLCERWKQNDFPQAIADGVDVDFVTDPNGQVPRFEVCTDSTCANYVGYKSYSSMKAAVQ